MEAVLRPCIVSRRYSLPSALLWAPESLAGSTIIQTVEFTESVLRSTRYSGEHSSLEDQEVGFFWRKSSSFLPDSAQCACERTNKFPCFLKWEVICACKFKMMKLVMRWTDLTLAPSVDDFLQIKLSISVVLSACNSCWWQENLLNCQLYAVKLGLSISLLHEAFRLKCLSLLSNFWKL